MGCHSFVRLSPPPLAFHQSSLKSYFFGDSTQKLFWWTKILLTKMIDFCEVSWIKCSFQQQENSSRKEEVEALSKAKDISAKEKCDMETKLEELKTHCNNLQKDVSLLMTLNPEQSLTSKESVNMFCVLLSLFMEAARETWSKFRACNNFFLKLLLMVQ